MNIFRYNRDIITMKIIIHENINNNNGSPWQPRYVSTHLCCQQSSRSQLDIISILGEFHNILLKTLCRILVPLLRLVRVQKN